MRRLQPDRHRPDAELTASASPCGRLAVHCPYMASVAPEPRLASERIELRLQPSQKATLARAAAVAGVKVAELIRDSALDRAEAVLAAQTSTVLPADYFDQLLDALDRPGEANQALREALEAAADIARR